MSGSPAQLAAKAVSVRFGGLFALSGVDVAIEAGEMLGLIGANGAGKSTLINVLSGFQRPSAGEVKLGSRSLVGPPPHRVARLGVSRTFQSVRLFRELSVYDNVAAAAAVLGKHAPDPADLLKAMDLLSQSGRPASSLPYAHQRRLAIARALALKPQFLLLDEPAAGMTPEEVRELDQALVSLRKRTGVGILLVEHNMALVMGVCERVVVLDGGRVIAQGPPHAVRRDPAVRRAYLGHTAEAAA
jgi:ABC-type branched-subunit amino acid transport system ATPase component